VKKLMILFYSIFLVLLSMNGSAQQPSSLRIYLFHNEECESCGSTLDGYLSTLKSTYPFIEIESLDVRNPSSRDLLGCLEKKCGGIGNGLPVAFVEDHVLSGEREIIEELEMFVLEYQIRKGLPQPSLGFPASANPS
jgi:hypothetical protein